MNKQVAQYGVTTRFDADRLEAIDRLAAQLGMTRHGLCRRAILHFISQPPASLSPAADLPAVRLPRADLPAA